MREKIKTKNLLSHFIFCLFSLFFFLFFILSCSRSDEKTEMEKIDILQTPEQEQPIVISAGARPLAILQPGKYPLWFQLTESGPALLDSIEDAIFSSAFIPWPFALHTSFFNLIPETASGADELFMAINGYGFIKLAGHYSQTSGETESLTMYCFPREIFQQYTIGGFVFYEDKPAALLYLDDRFLDTDAPHPLSRTWTFNMESNRPFPLDIPALEFFPAEDGWSADTLRLGSDGFWYYRVRRFNAEIHILRTADLSKAGEPASLAAFQNSTPVEPELTEDFYLPDLPDGFVYTGVVKVGDTLIAFWEEQDNFFIGAAGFMVLGL
jgi:hypothetical protein